jgi:hypothetical protein
MAYTTGYDSGLQLNFGKLLATLEQTLWPHSAAVPANAEGLSSNRSDLLINNTGRL